jgi:prophage antirepressor-like protein
MKTPSALDIAHLYIVENSLQLVKIGIAGNPAKRIKALEANSGAPIIRRHISDPCLKCRDLEATMHRHFAEQRQAGEWFAIAFDDAVAALSEMQAQPAPSQAITPFEFKGHALRTVNRDGEMWFVARDVCDCLELEHITNALSRLRDNEKLTVKILQSGQDRDMWLVNEPGLYRLIFTSNKPQAQAFQDWVYHDVLPAIRQTGGYSLHPQGQITPEIQAIIQASVKAEFAALYDKIESAALVAKKNIAAKLVRNNGLPTEFVEFMQAHVIMGAEYNTRAAFHAFKRFSRQHGGMKQRSFTRWLVRFADSNDLPFMSRRSNGRTFFTVGGAK